MFHDTIFKTHVFSPDKALSAGFVQEGDVFTKRMNLSEEGFYVIFSVSSEHLSSQVFEEPDGEEYLPYHVASENGGFAHSIRENVEDLLDDIVNDCFVLADVKMLLLDYARQKYGTVPEAPWDYLPEYHTLKTRYSKKWYGLFMYIPYKNLGIEEEGKINVLNVKVEPSNIPFVIDNVHYFPSYHLNKKYWISILLDRDADLDKIKSLLDDSYEIVEKKNF